MFESPPVWTCMTPEQRMAVVSKRTKFRKNLLEWSSVNSRGYAWREEGSDLYQVLVAEILLKRTTATAAQRAFKPFLKRFPTLEALTLATESQLVREFGPIGLKNQRAHAVLRMVRWISDREEGVIPNSLDRLLKIPGLGPYSARAVLSFGFNIPISIVDGNVSRIITRVFQKSLDFKQTIAVVQRVGDLLLPKSHHKKFNYALIDLGGTVCKPTRPKCDHCPLNWQCDYVEIMRQGVAAPPITALKSVRISMGMSLVTLSKKTGLSKQTVMNAESGRTRPKYQTLKALAMELGVAPEKLGIVDSE